MPRIVQKRKRTSSRHSPIRAPSPDVADFDPSGYFQLDKVHQKKWKRGAVAERCFRIKVVKEVKTSNPLKRQLLIHSIMEAAFKDIVDTAPRGCKAQVYVVNPQLRKSCISTCRTGIEDLTFRNVAERLSSAIQSDESIKLTETKFYLSTYTEKSKVGTRLPGLRTRYEYSLDIFARSKKCLWNPTPAFLKISADMKNLCFPLVLANEIHVLEQPTMSRRALRNFQKTHAFRKRALQLVHDAGLHPSQAPFTLDQLPLFLKCLPQGVALNVYDDSAPPFLQLGPPGPRSINVFLKFNVDEQASTPTFHAYGITSMTAFMGTRKFCHYCFKGHKAPSKRGHQCPVASCKLCKYMECNNRKTERRYTLRFSCEACNVGFYTRECYEAHQPACGERIKCKLCAEFCSKADYDTHPCGRPLCHKCKVNHSPLDYCFVQKDTRAPHPPPVVWYADTETQVDPVTKDQSVNLMILQRFDNTDNYEYCGPDAMKEFTAACMTKNSPFKKSIIVFHNAAGFDAHFWYKELIKAKAPPKNFICKGQKIISMEMAQNAIKCRDSLQFLPGTPLASLPNMFGLESGPKGEFPHGLNTPRWIQWGKNIIYREVIDGAEHRFPLLKYFWPEQKRQEGLAALKSWHKEMVSKHEQDPSLEYCPEQELVEYCRQDVRILREGFEKYRKTWVEQYPGLEPLDSLTFPAYNNKIFRDVYMPKDSLCLLPPRGYDMKNHRYSIISMAWIAWMERLLGLRNVRTARKGFEVKILGHYVDGTGVDSHGNLHILQFHGCYWHGHDCMIKRNEIMDTLRENTAALDKKLQELSTNPSSPYGRFTYHRIFECEFRAERDGNPALDAFTKDYLSQFSEEPLRLREALRGGRTNAIKHQIVPVPIGWSLHYVDFTSLYPAVNFGINGEVWPIGHPEIYIGKDLELAPPETKDWFGFANVVLLPPTDLLHPVLGQSIGGKLLFHLCTTCAESLHKDYCTHSDEEREIKGTFFTGEISLAISKGYRLIRTQELWHWPVEQRSPDLFRGLILDQYAKKALSSAVPKDPIQFQRLLDEYKDTMGLELKEEDFKENKALRALAKFSLNNIWGFLGKRNDLEKTEFVSSFAHFLELQNDEDIEITRTEITNDEENIQVTFKPLQEEPSAKGNIALAAMTTAYARMALYQVIDKYQKQVVYMDTDSLFLLLPPGMAPPPSSTVLGGLKDEIHEEFGAGAKITQFASIGPKSYTYTVKKDGVVLKEVVRMKGISFTSEASSVVTPAAMRGLKRGGEKLLAPQHIIRKNISKTRVWNTEVVKRVQFQSNKRWFKRRPNPLLNTLPYGFV